MVILNLQNCADSLPGASYGAMIKIIFAYSPGGNGYKLDLGMNYHQRFTGEQRNQVEKARRITAEQKVVLGRFDEDDEDELMMSGYGREREGCQLGGNVLVWPHHTQIPWA